MRNKGAVLALALLPLLVLAIVLYTRVGPAETKRHEREMRGLAARREALHDSLVAIMARDSLLQFAQTDSADVAVGLSEPLVRWLFADLTTRYLDHIELDLEPEIERSKAGEIKVNTPLGRMKVGDWNVDVAIHRISGVLAARTPEVRFSGTNRLHLAIPADVLQGQGEVTLHFTWDPKSAFSIVCRDFEAIEKVQGFVLPQRHVVRGDLVLTAGERSIVAEPHFPREKYPLAMTLDSASWSRVREVLQGQDKMSRCGMFMNPDDVIERLRRRGFEGIKIKLPKKLFRTVVLPASINKSVKILHSPVEISVRPNQLRVSPGYFWYSTDIDARPTLRPAEPLPVPAPAR